jgi:hypothetical protein
MDNQDHPPTSNSPATPVAPVPINPVQTGTVPAQGVVAPTSQPAKPELAVPDAAALALLTVSNVQANTHPERKFPTKMVIAIVALIILVLAASGATGFFKSKQSSDLTGQGSVPAQQNQPGTGNSSDTTKQINKDVQSCTDPVNAVTVC